MDNAETIYGNGAQKDFVISGLGVLCLNIALPANSVLRIQMHKRRPKDAPCIDWRDDEWCNNCGGCSR
jgi:hypothetical protein